MTAPPHHTVLDASLDCFRSLNTVPISPCSWHSTVFLSPDTSADLMLSLAALPHPAVLDAALDYFQSLNTVPMAARHPQLQRPLFESLLPLLFRHACHPEGFTSWEEETEVDEEAFHRFRCVVKY